MAIRLRMCSNMLNKLRMKIRFFFRALADIFALSPQITVSSCSEKHKSDEDNV